MTKSQPDFDKEEDEIIACCQLKYSLNKKDAIKKLVRIAGESDSIKNILKEKRKNDKK